MMKFDCYPSVFKPDKKRHLWLISVLFALVIMVHYLKFPNETTKRTFFSLEKFGWWWDSNRGNEAYQMDDASLGSKKETKDLKNGLALGNGTNAEPNRHKKTPFDPTNSTVQISLPPEMATCFTSTPMASPSPLSQSDTDITNATLVDVSPSPKEVIAIKKTVSDSNISCENPMVKKMAMTQKEMGAVSFSEMKNMLFLNQSSHLLIKPLWSSIVDQELLNAKSEIENAESIQDDDEDDLHAPLYWNVSKFKRSYELMEKTLKVYIYMEGERPVFHKPDLRGIYASEGWFMKQLTTNTKYITDDPRKAHLFYLPFGSHNLQRSLYVPDSHSFANLIEYLNGYLQLIRGRYPFWNRTCGADHFLVACHDWAAEETRWHMANCIRSLCNADLREGFQFGKDVSLPETYMHFAQDPLKNLGGNAPSERSFLAFFAGKMHGDLRPTLLKHWENKDPDMKIFGRMNRKDYAKHMKKSRYCIRARGYEVNSPRVVEAISYECVPVIVSDNFVAPFLEALNWESFAVFVPEKEIPNLKRLLESIPEKRYVEMHERVKHVQRHFLWHNPVPQKYDVFRMILHSIWYTRVFRTTE